MSKLISVIIPVYNVEKELEKCLYSVVNQTYSNLEIILVDDGSIDMSGKICDEWKKKDNRIKVFHQENRGISVARNVGLDHASGEFISFVDSDDFIDNNMYSFMVHALNEYGADIAICDVCEFTDEVSETDNKQYRIESVCNCVDLFSKFQEKPEIKINHVTNKLYRRDIISDSRFTPGLVGCEDWDFNLDILINVNNGVVLDNQLYFYYLRDNSITHIKITDDSYYIGLAKTYVKQAVNMWKIDNEEFAIDNASYCLNRLARYSTRREFCENKLVKNAIIKEFRTLYGSNKKYIGKMKDKWKIRLAYYVYPIYRLLIG